MDFNAGLDGALSSEQSALPVDDKGAVNRYSIRFNQEIDAIVRQHGEEAAGRAIWYVYGCCSGYMHDVLDPSLGDLRLEFMESVKLLYREGFNRYCAHFFGHLDDGPEPSRPMNSGCYMLWDMDGIECPAMSGDRPMVAASLNTLQFALTLSNPACQESALHELGHLAFRYRLDAEPVIRDYLSSRRPEEPLKSYAERAANGYVL